MRLEEQLHRQSGRTYPRCVAGNGACPAEGCGGPAAYLVQRTAWHSDEGLDDLAVMAEFVDEVVLKDHTEHLEDSDLAEEMRDVLERLEIRRSWQGTPFLRRTVNTRLKKGDHLSLMHQQW
ncbi:hypothetical protein X737_31060 [Mesorhizobium sp. L48C026A00]|nr:hypothetical protein X737_31060 [Mesorhizobium sp. L48C026A00]